MDAASLLARWRLLTVADAEAEVERGKALTADLVSRRMALIATPTNTSAALAAKAATTTIPIVFQSGSDRRDHSADPRYPGGGSEQSARARRASSASPGGRFNVKARPSTSLHSSHCLS